MNAFNFFKFFGRYLSMIAITLILVGIWAVCKVPSREEFAMVLSIPMLQSLIGGIITYRLYKKYKKEENRNEHDIN